MPREQQAAGGAEVDAGGGRDHGLGGELVHFRVGAHVEELDGGVVAARGEGEAAAAAGGREEQQGRRSRRKGWMDGGWRQGQKDSELMPPEAGDGGKGRVMGKSTGAGEMSAGAAGGGRRAACSQLRAHKSLSAAGGSFEDRQGPSAVPGRDVHMRTAERIAAAATVSCRSGYARSQLARMQEASRIAASQAAMPAGWRACCSRA